MISMCPLVGAWPLMGKFEKIEADFGISIAPPPKLVRAMLATLT